MKTVIALLTELADANIWQVSKNYGFRTPKPGEREFQLGIPTYIKSLRKLLAKINDKTRGDQQHKMLKQWATKARNTTSNKRHITTAEFYEKCCQCLTTYPYEAAEAIAYELKAAAIQISKELGTPLKLNTKVTENLSTLVYLELFNRPYPQDLNLAARMQVLRTALNKYLKKKLTTVSGTTITHEATDWTIPEESYTPILKVVYKETDSTGSYTELNHQFRFNIKSIIFLTSIGQSYRSIYHNSAQVVAYIRFTIDSINHKNLYFHALRDVNAQKSPGIDKRDFYFTNIFMNFNDQHSHAAPFTLVIEYVDINKDKKKTQRIKIPLNRNYYEFDEDHYRLKVREITKAFCVKALGFSWKEANNLLSNDLLNNFDKLIKTRKKTQSAATNQTGRGAGAGAGVVADTATASELPRPEADNSEPPTSTTAILLEPPFPTASTPPESNKEPRRKFHRTVNKESKENITIQINGKDYRIKGISVGATVKKVLEAITDQFGKELDIRSNELSRFMFIYRSQRIAIPATEFGEMVYEETHGAEQTVGVIISIRDLTEEERTARTKATSKQEESPDPEPSAPPMPSISPC
jgi:hypothetical protein